MELKNGEFICYVVRPGVLNAHSGRAEIVYDEGEGCAEIQN